MNQLILINYCDSDFYNKLYSEKIDTDGHIPNSLIKLRVTEVITLNNYRNFTSQSQVSNAITNASGS